MNPSLLFFKKKYVFNEKSMKKARFEPAIFQSEAKRSTKWAIQPSYRRLQHFIILIDNKQQPKYTKGIFLHELPWNHEICIYTKSAHLNSVFCQNFEFFYHFQPSRIAESPPTFNKYYGCIWPVCSVHSCSLSFPKYMLTQGQAVAYPWLTI